MTADIDALRDWVWDADHDDITDRIWMADRLTAELDAEIERLTAENQRLRADLAVARAQAVREALAYLGDVIEDCTGAAIWMDVVVGGDPYDGTEGPLWDEAYREARAAGGATPSWVRAQPSTLAGQEPSDG